MSNPYILYIEDEPSVRELTTVMLDIILDQQYELRVLEDVPSYDTCSMVWSDNPQLIIMDCKLPSIDLCQDSCLTQLPTGVPVVLVSGDEWSKPLAPNMRICRKPYSLDELRSAVDQSLRHD